MRARFLNAFLGPALFIALSSSTWAEDPEDLAYAKDQLQKILEFDRTGIEIRWRNPNTGNGGHVLVERTYFMDPKTPCRDFIVTLDGGGGPSQSVRGTGCRSVDGNWQLGDGIELSSISAMMRGWDLVGPDFGGNSDHELTREDLVELDLKDNALPAAAAPRLENEALRQFMAEGRRRDSSILEDTIDDIGPGDAASAEILEEPYPPAAIQAIAVEALSAPEFQPKWTCASDPAGESSIGVKELDTVFLLDTTSSMRRELVDFQANIMSSVRLLLRMAPCLNVGVVAFRDRGDAYQTRAFQLAPMTEDNVKRLGIFVERLKARGGGDVPEAVDEALALAKGMPWRPTALGEIIVISDAPAHADAESRALELARDFHNHSPAGVVQRRVSAIYSGNSFRRNSVEFYRRLAESGGGRFTFYHGVLTESILLSILDRKPS